jgi:hypothetical protein
MALGLLLHKICGNFFTKAWRVTSRAPGRSLIVNPTLSFVMLGIWFGLSLVVGLFHDGTGRDSVTRLLILAFFLLSLWWFYRKGRFIEIKHPGRTFIAWCTINAMAVEIFHMFSRPLSPSLLITVHTPWVRALKNISIDLMLTLPAYLIIFLVIWRLLERYYYSAFPFFFLIALGQALGDGGVFFMVNPGALLLIPYVMLNYWAMNFVPYLVVQKNLFKPVLPACNWKANLLPVLILPLVYWITGGVILAIGRSLGWI